mgnify:CR=1 FL=1
MTVTRVAMVNPSNVTYFRNFLTLPTLRGSWVRYLARCALAMLRLLAWIAFADLLAKICTYFFFFLGCTGIGIFFLCFGITYSLSVFGRYRFGLTLLYQG